MSVVQARAPEEGSRKAGVIPSQDGLESLDKQSDHKTRVKGKLTMPEACLGLTL